MNDKRGTVTPERVAMDEEAKRLRTAARYLGEEKRRQGDKEQKILLLWLLFVVACGGVVGGLACSLTPVVDRPEVATADSESPPDIWATDGANDGGLPVAGPVPSTPLKGQKKPPCDPKREKEINGGCWVEIVGAVGEDNCGDYYAWGGRCHIPVKQAKRPPTSVMP